MNKRKEAIFLKLTISTNNETESKRLILFLILALSKSLQNNIITIEDAENLLFNPYSVKKICKIDEDIANIIQLGCELEDIESLIPNNLLKAITEIYDVSLEKLKNFNKVEVSSKKWID